ncbi:dTDP-4-dehydrorhamnose 3,5-epimerase family protein [Paraburkholderia sp. RL17-337-BIB-A]|uniref:dTDP-4-dehydrorhamnose 3,5-epimerase family protein n=1 Tax=Paraburkholderia sp. RL17-337-BIB-A TaxID=3031636 RepID=UPI0038B7FE23
MTMKVQHIPIRAVKLIEPYISSDARGVFFESFDQNEFDEQVARGYPVSHEHHTVSPREGVRHFLPDLVSWQDEKTQAIPDGCIG